MTATVTAIKSHSTTDIVVYTGPDCADCMRTKNYLTSKGIGFLEVDITTDTTAAERLRAAGHARLPVVETPHATWAGIRPDKLIELTSQVHIQRLA